ncbi:1-deoxy-D-xylulose-5-phosphate reductoisomerase [Methyloceanibacter sp. wino2]|uniref:1-deoxy-D-xylulose-5-phosphate reductoisomerase n=1 Tax=Methyloceanibacter sp. wino2 TaxID=2170729 RepID=UPI00352D69BF
MLGATGSIGESTLDLVGRNPDGYEVIALTGNKNVARLAELAVQHGAKLAVTADAGSYKDLLLALAGTGIEVAAGPKALLDAASRPADWIMAAIVGVAGLRPTLRAVKQGTTVALANKECLVSGGEIFMREVARHGATLLPVDSEHSAARQAMTGTEPDKIESVCLTASGGPFRTWSVAQMAEAGPEQALKHPNWSMGAKVTIDSASLMNKGLELIEAHHLFALPPEKLCVLVHPQSIVHCLVQMTDGAVLAQLSCPDMRTPIAYSLAWPERMHVPNERIDLAMLGSLTFEAPDPERFPALRLAKEVLDTGGGAGAVLNAANEVAVAAFLEKRLGFLGIAGLVETTLVDCADLIALTAETAEDVYEIDEEARRRARDRLPRWAGADAGN